MSPPVQSRSPTVRAEPLAGVTDVKLLTVLTGSVRISVRPGTRTVAEVDASGPAIKARFKELVKRHHPDANGGDRSSEDKLREIIQAYNYLKSIGFR